MNSSRTVLTLVAAALLTGASAHASVVTLNGTCEINGPCDATTLQNTAISSGQSIPQTAFSFFYTFAGTTDKYNISGNYAASYGSGGNAFQVNLGIAYVSNSTNTASLGDTLTVNVFQDIFDNSPGTFDGTYTESVPVTISGSIGSDSSVTANLFYDGEGVGAVGPFVGPGTYLGQQSAYLTGLTGNYLYEDFQFTYNITAGTNAGGGIMVTPTPAVPEPMEMIPVSFSLVIFICVTLTIKRRQSSHKGN